MRVRFSTSFALKSATALQDLIDGSKPKGAPGLGSRLVGQKSDLRVVCRKQDTMLGIVAIGHNWHRRATMERLLSLAPVSSLSPDV